MREKLKTLPLSELKELAKAQGLKGVSGMRKADIIELLCRQEGTGETAPEAQPAEPETQPAKTEQPVRPERTFRAERPRTERGERQEPRGQMGEGRRLAVRNYERTEQRQDRPERSDRTERQDRPERGDRAEQRPDTRQDSISLTSQDMAELDSGIEANGILEVMQDGFGFIRCENFLPGENDVYVAPSQIRRFNLKTGDIIVGNRRVKSATEKFAALLYIKTVNGYPLSTTETRKDNGGPAGDGSAFSYWKGAERYDRVSAKGRQDDPFKAGGRRCYLQSSGYAFDHPPY